MEIRVKSTLGNLFSFEEQTLVTEDGYITYRIPRGRGGWYDSAEAAEHAGRLELPWLRTKTEYPN